MNKKGFTLVELLAVIVIIGIISLIAVPNVVNIINSNKEDTMLGDARKLISLAKYEINVTASIRDGEDNNCTETGAEVCHKFSFADLNKNGDIKTDPDGGVYDTSSYVKYTKKSGVVHYCIYLGGEVRGIGSLTKCVAEEDLFDKGIVVGY